MWFYGDLTKSHGWAVITGPPLHAETGLWRAHRGGHPSKNEKVWSKSVDGLRLCNPELLKDEKSLQNRKKWKKHCDSLPRDLAKIDAVVRNCVRRLGGLLAYLNSSFYLARQCSSVYSYGKRVSMKTFLRTINSDWMLLTLSPPRSH